MNVSNRAIDWRNLRRQLKSTSAFNTLATLSAYDLTANSVATRLIVELGETVPNAAIVAALLELVPPLISAEELVEIESLIANSNVVLPSPSGPPS